MIRFILNKVPRPLLQRLAGLAMPLVRLYYSVGRGPARGKVEVGLRARGDSMEAGRGGRVKDKGVECPICGGRYRRFMPYGYVEVRKNALCPGCLSLERHRLLWLWLGRQTDLLKEGRQTDPPTSGPKFLHIAPEVCLSKRFKKIYGSKRNEGFRQRGADAAPTEDAREGIVQNVQTRPSSEEARQVRRDHGSYITADLESPLADVRLDVQNITFADGAFDVVFCNHVLEHVPDDRLAMREMFRVMRPGGWGVLLSPVDRGREATFEDDSITSPEERTRVFGQYDHRRVYGRDYGRRLAEAGFEVSEIDFFATLTPDEQRRFGLRTELLHIVRKPR
ncbi:MAG: methyltransferase domain-containing protein [Alistipes sp.]|jgi:hypothetical protein|nr:methyltransferase domain-containing protein [Alistipes sp.]